MTGKETKRAMRAFVRLRLMEKGYKPITDTFKKSSEPIDIGLMITPDHTVVDVADITEQFAQFLKEKEKANGK